MVFCIASTNWKNKASMSIRPSTSDSDIHGNPRHITFAIKLAAFVLLLIPSMIAQAELRATAVIQGDRDGGRIDRHIYGHFAEHLGRCVYDGLWVGEDSPISNVGGVRTDVVEALRRIKIPNLRWPGGCFADDYHWRDGIGPAEDRPRTINMHWGDVIDTNAFGTHEFLNLCELLDCEPYIAGNVGSGTPGEMRNWIEYMTSDSDSELANLRRRNGRDRPWKISFFGVGNENWGCGGNMRPEYYADVYRQFANYCRDFNGNRLTRVASGPSGFDPQWTRVLMGRAARDMQAYSVHFYTHVDYNWPQTGGGKVSATGFGENEWFAVLSECSKMDRLLVETEQIMDEHDPDHRIGLYVDEWGAWYQVELGHPGSGLYQQNSLRDALLAGITLHIFHEHNKRVTMANIAQLANVLQALLLTDGEHLILTPTYHVFEMYKVHQNATRLPIELESPNYEHSGRVIPALSASASRDENGIVHVSITNAHAKQGVHLAVELEGIGVTQVSGRILTAEALDAHNTIEAPQRVEPTPFLDVQIDDGRLNATIPPHSVVVLELRS
jgi:alpha-N-arabinofuranosidase